MEVETTYQKLRRIIYLGASTLLGVLLFIFIQQVLVHLLSLSSGRFGFVIQPGTLNLIDAIGTVVALAFGAWYGVWLGSYWYQRVYGKGFLADTNLRASGTSGRRPFESPTWQVEDLLDKEPPLTPEPQTPAIRVNAQPEKAVSVKKTVRKPKAASTRVKKVKS